MDGIMRPWRRRSLLLVLCFVSSSLLLPVSSQTSSDSCASGLNLGSLVPFNTTGLSCFKAWTLYCWPGEWNRHDLFLRFGRDAPGSNLWNFVLSAPDNGRYIAMGFSPTRKMVGSSAVVGWITADGAGTARQYYLGGWSSSLWTPDQGELALSRAAAPTIVSKGSRLYLAFQISGKPLTDVIYAIGPSRKLANLPGSKSNGLLPMPQAWSIDTITLPGGGGSPATGGGGVDGDDGNEGGRREW